MFTPETKVFRLPDKAKKKNEFYGGSPDRVYHKAGRGKYATWVTNNEPDRLMRGSDRDRLIVPARHHRWTRTRADGRQMMRVPDAYVGPAYDPCFDRTMPPGRSPPVIKEKEKKYIDPYEMLRLDKAPPEELMKKIHQDVQGSKDYWKKLRLLYRSGGLMLHVKKDQKKRMSIDVHGGRLTHGHDGHAHEEKRREESEKASEAASTSAKAEKRHVKAKRKVRVKEARQALEAPGRLETGGSLHSMDPEHVGEHVPHYALSRSESAGPIQQTKFHGSHQRWVCEPEQVPYPWECRHPYHIFHDLGQKHKHLHEPRVLTGAATVDKKNFWRDRYGGKKHQHARILDDNDAGARRMFGLRAMDDGHLRKEIADFIIATGGIKGKVEHPRDFNGIVDHMQYKVQEKQQVVHAHVACAPRSRLELNAQRPYDHFAELERNRGCFSPWRAKDMERLSHHALRLELTGDLLNVHDTYNENPELFEEVYMSSRIAYSIARSNSAPARSRFSDIGGCINDHVGFVNQTQGMKDFLLMQRGARLRSRSASWLPEPPISEYELFRMMRGEGYKEEHDLTEPAPAPAAPSERPASPFLKFSERELYRFQLGQDMRAQQAFEMEMIKPKPGKTPAKKFAPAPRIPLSPSGRLLLQGITPEVASAQPPPDPTRNAKSWVEPKSPTSKSLAGALDEYPAKLVHRRKRDEDFEKIQNRAYIKGSTRSSIADNTVPEPPFRKEKSEGFETPKKVSRGTPLATYRQFAQKNRAYNDPSNPFGKIVGEATQSFRSFKPGAVGNVVARNRGQHESTYEGFVDKDESDDEDYAPGEYNSPQDW